jgi:peptidoglycan/LPS O-acetylase OafA/YrhL
MRLVKVDHSERVYGLDVMRAAAIILVVMGHAAFLAGDIFSFLPSVPLIDGVELFFVLSGFLIGSMLIRSVDRSQRFGMRELGIFLKRRWFRTLPNYYLVLGINFLLVSLAVVPGKPESCTWHFLLFVQNFSEGFTDFFWESWSLSVEEWFYIFLPVLLLAFLRFLPAKPAFLLITLSLIIAPLAYRFSISGKEVDAFWWDVHFRKVVLTRLDAIGYGVLMAWLKFYCGSFFYRVRNWMLLAGIVIVYIALEVPRDHNGVYMKVFSFCLVSFGASLLLPKADSVKNFRFAPIGRLVTFISVISYSMYLVNLGIVAGLFQHYLTPHRRLENALYYGLFWIVTFALSTLLYRFFEKPVTDLRDKVWKR